MKRKIRLLLAVVLAMAMVMGSSVTALALEGNGSQDDPYRISTMETGNHLQPYGPDYEIYVKNDTERTLYVYADNIYGDSVCFTDEPTQYADFTVEFPDGASNILDSDSTIGWAMPADGDTTVAIRMSAPVPPDNTQPTSEYNYNPWDDYATPMINAAEAGQTITFEFGEWNSFPKSFMAELADKSAQNITFVFHYKWDHVEQEITIPAGTPIDLSCDWYGPAKMAELYGAN